MKLLLDGKAKKIYFRKGKEDFEAILRGDDGEEDIQEIDEVEQMRLATQESLRSHHEWEDRR